jgi:multiple sugar transport system substrate-binding protein
MTLPSSRRMLALTGAVTLALALGACGASQQTGGVPSGHVAAAADLSKCDPTKNTLSIFSGQQGAAAVEVAKKAMLAKYPGLTINVEDSKAQHYPDLTQQVVGEVAVGKTPDVIQSGLNYFRFWVDQYHPAPIDVNALPAAYQKQFLAAGTVHGQVYMAPFQVSVPGLLVNKTYLQQAGLDPNTPITTYDQLLSVAKAITAKTGKPSINMSTDTLGDWFEQVLVQGAGGTFATADGGVGFDTPVGKQALALYETLAKAKVETPIGYADGFAAFNAGQLPIFAASTSYISRAIAGVKGKFDWSVEDFPTIDAQHPAQAMPAGGNGWLVLSQDPCRAAYGSVMVGLLLGKDASLAASGATFSYIPVNKDAATELLAGPNVAPQLRWAWTYSKPLTGWGGFQGKNTGAIIQALTDMGSKLERGADTSSTVDATSARISALAKG